jgi:hypothetical protein
MVFLRFSEGFDFNEWSDRSTATRDKRSAECIVPESKPSQFSCKAIAFVDSHRINRTTRERIAGKTRFCGEDPASTRQKPSERAAPKKIKATFA